MVNEIALFRGRVPFGVGRNRSHHDLRKEHPDEQRKVYWSSRSLSNDLRSSDGSHGQVSHGIPPGNENRNHSGILCRTVGNLRRRDPGGLALRSAEAAYGQGIKRLIAFRMRCPFLARDWCHLLDSSYQRFSFELRER
jgi:hypothetical protein